MDRTVASFGEGEVRHVAPQLEGLPHLLVHLRPGDEVGVRVLGDSVGEVQGSPTAG